MCKGLSSNGTWLICVLFFVFVHSNPLIAASAPAAVSLKTLDPKAFCPAAGGLVSKATLARAIIDLYKVSQSMIDWNDTGSITEEDNIRGVTVNLCGAPTNPRQFRLCQSQDDKGKPIIGVGGRVQPTSDANAQGKIVVELIFALEGAQKNHPDGHGGFIWALSKTSVHFAVHDAPPTKLDSAQKPLLAQSNTSLPAQALSSDYYDIECVKPASPSANPGSTVPGGGLPVEGATSKSSNLLDRFRIRAKTDDLPVSRDSDAFSGLTAASLAITDDNIAKKNTFDTHVVVGYTLPTLQVGRGDTAISSIPFIQYDRDFVDGAKAPPNASNVNNFTAGIQESIIFPINDRFYNSLLAQPYYIWSLRNGAQIAKLHLALQPEPLLPFFGFAAPTFIPSVSATAYARGVLNVGQVVRSTPDPTLATTNNFVQGGAQLGAALFSADETSILNGFSLPLDYTNLYGFSGQYKSIHLFSVALNYTLPKTKYITIGTSYTTGRNVDTFEQQQVYKFSLGVKY